MNVTDKYDLVVMFGLDTSLKNTADFLCKLLIEANAIPEFIRFNIVECEVRNVC